MADPKKRIGYYHKGTYGDPKHFKALAARGRVMGRNFLYFEKHEVEDFDVVVAGAGVDAEALQSAYGKVPVMTANEFLGTKDEPAKKAKEEPPFDPDAPAKSRQPKKQG